jgi:hypothetical protein
MNNFPSQFWYCARSTWTCPIRVPPHILWCCRNAGCNTLHTFKNRSINFRFWITGTLICLFSIENVSHCWFYSQKNRTRNLLWLIACTYILIVARSCDGLSLSKFGWLK